MCAMTSKCEVGSWKLEVGSRKSEVGSRKLEVGSRKTLLGFRSVLLVFSVAPFKIDQNKNQNHSTDKVQNLGNERR